MSVSFPCANLRDYLVSANEFLKEFSKIYFCKCSQVIQRSSNENLDHKEKIPKYDHTLSEVDGLHGKRMGSQATMSFDK